MQTIRLSTTPGVVNPGAYLSQYDVGRQMLFLLYDDVGKYIPAAGSTAHIRATKPSGFGFDVACIWSQNSVTVTVTDEMSNESGSFGAELRIEKDGNILGTANFLWNVERSTHLNGTVDGNTEARGLYQDILDAIEDAEDAAEEAREAAEHGAALSDEIKQALLQIARKVAYIDAYGQDYYEDLYDALYPPIPATSVTLNRGSLYFHSLNETAQLTATVLPEDTTDTLVWSSSDETVATVSQTGLVTAIAYGSATITATAGEKSATCSVLASEATISSISAVFNQGAAVVYDNDELDTLKQYLTVTATWSDSSTETLEDEDYTLTGTLTTGTSTVTVNYAGKTTTFTVTVTHYTPSFSITNVLSHVASSNAGVTSVEEGDSYATSLGIETGYTLNIVKVTMGGTDVTSTVYNDSTRAISIASVTGNVVITAKAVIAPDSISATFTQGGAKITDEDDLDDLRPYLVVTATTGGTTETLASDDYALSGTLTLGTSTITASYGGASDTFTVTVTSGLNNITQDGGTIYVVNAPATQSGDTLTFQ